MLGIRTHRVFVPALVLFCSAAACRKNPAEQSAAAQTPAAQPAETPAPPKPMPAQLPDVLARVNGQDVTKVDFDRLVKNMEAGRGAIPAERRDEVLRGALDQLITYSVLKQEAASRKFAVADADVDAQVASMQKQFPHAGRVRQGARRPEHHRRTAQGRRARRHGHQQDDGSRSGHVPSPPPTPTRRTSTTRTPTSSSSRNPCAPATS